MRIVHATSVHPAKDNRIAHKECRSAAEHGHEVVLVAARGEDPGIPGVEVVMVEGPSTRFDRFTRVVPRVAKAVLRAEPDIIHIHDPELLLVARRLSRRAPVVFDVHEDIPAQIRTKHWIPRVLRVPLSHLSRWVLRVSVRYVSAVVCAEPTVADSFAREGVVVQNFPRLEEFACARTRDAVQTDALHVSYVGVIARLRGAVEMVEAAGLLDERLGAVFHLAGSIDDPALREELEHLEGWQRVRYSDWLGRPEVAQLLAETDIGLVPLYPAPNYVEAYPTKMFEYMAAGCAVIASDLPLMRRILEEVECGVLVEPGNTDALVTAIEDLAADRGRLAQYGRVGRAAIEERYSWANEAQKLMALYDQISTRR